jgi:hypothetical protein
MYPAREIVASAARTTNGDSGAVIPAVGRAADTVSIMIRATAIVGTPSLAISIEWSMDGVNFAPGDPVDTMTAITAAVSRIKVFEAKAPYYRVVWGITGGTPSITFSVWEWVNAD